MEIGQFIEEGVTAWKSANLSEEGVTAWIGNVTVWKSNATLLSF
jgi:hypothetical protein